MMEHSNDTENACCFSVKLWSTNLDNSVASIEAKANVCCVKFSPTSRYHLAFGCAGKFFDAIVLPFVVSEDKLIVFFKM